MELTKSETPKPKELPQIACAYCSESFIPRKRWVHKYCSESCRTLACRQRRLGIGGTLTNKKRSVSASDIAASIDSYTTSVNQWLAEIVKHSQSVNLQLELVKIQTSPDITGRIFEYLSKLESLESTPKNIQELKDTLKDMQANGLNAIKTTLDQLQRQQLAIELRLAKIEGKQSTQDMLIILSSIFGPSVGDAIINFGKKTIFGNEGNSVEEKIDKIMELAQKFMK